MDWKKEFKRLLSELTSAKSESSKTRQKQTFDLTLEPVVKREGDRLFVSFKAGIGRLYVVKDLTEFVNNYEKQKVMTFGSKTEIDFKKHRIKESSRALFEYVQHVVEDEKCRNNYVKKKIELFDDRLDAFADLCEDQATFVFYLDLEEGHITCKPEVLYGDIKVSLLDHKKEEPHVGSFRDIEREKEVLAILQEYFSEIDMDRELMYCAEDEDALGYLLEEGIDHLREIGEVLATEKLNDIHIKKKPKVEVGVSVKSNLMDLSIQSEGIEKEELLQLLQSYTPKKKYYRLKNGDLVETAEEDMETLYQLMETLDVTPKELVEGNMHLPAYRAFYINQMLEQNTNIEANRDAEFEELIRKFEEEAPGQFMVPKSLEPIMRSYQIQGFQWLKTLEYYGFGGILADDMGLGKTLQVISVLLSAKESKKEGTALIVCPASLVYNWKEELKRFAPELTVSLIVGNRKERVREIHKYKKSDVLVTSYDLLKRDIAEYESAEFAYQIIDEAQYIKNHGTDAAKTVKLIHSKQRFALTGTPIENRLSELWSIFDYLMPGFLYSYDTFRKDFEKPIVKQKDQAVLQKLKKMVSPFILRRLKGDVLKDLPEKIEKNCYVRFDSVQQKVYDAQVVRMCRMLDEKEEEDFRKEQIEILAELTRIRQICCEPKLLFENYDGGSAKKDACMELIKSAIAGEHKMLVFSQFTSVLEVLEEKLNDAHISYYKIIGDTPKEARMEMVKAFNKDATPVFLISLKAGGTGLNLTGADMVIHYDPWWNQAAQNQATDRAHRIGQKKPVTVYKIIAKDTIEEKIMDMQEEKSLLAESVLTGENKGLSGMSKAEFMDLLRR